MTTDPGAAGKCYEGHAIRQYQMLHEKDSRVFHRSIPDRILFYASGIKDLDIFRDTKRLSTGTASSISNFFGMDGVAIDKNADDEGKIRNLRILEAKIGKADAHVLGPTGWRYVSLLAPGNEAHTVPPLHLLSPVPPTPVIQRICASLGQGAFVHVCIPPPVDDGTDTFQLMEWQEKAAEAALQEWTRQRWAVQLSAMTGLGKTIAAWHIMKQSGRSLHIFASPTVELARQAAQDARSIGHLVHVVTCREEENADRTLEDIDALAAREAAGSDVGYIAMAICHATLGPLARRGFFHLRKTVVLAIDEAHRMQNRFVVDVCEAEQVPCILISATPRRDHGLPVIADIGLEEGIRLRRLVPLHAELVAPSEEEGDADSHLGVHGKATAAAAWLYANNLETCVVFCSRIQEADEFAKLLETAMKSEGVALPWIRCMHSGASCPSPREVLASFVGISPQSFCKVLVTVDMLKLGFDWPRLQAVIVLAPSADPASLLQMVARVLRYERNKIEGRALLFGEEETAMLLGRLMAAYDSRGAAIRVTATPCSYVDSVLREERPRVSARLHAAANRVRSLSLAFALVGRDDLLLTQTQALVAAFPNMKPKQHEIFKYNLGENTYTRKALAWARGVAGEHWEGLPEAAVDLLRRLPWWHGLKLADKEQFFAYTAFLANEGLPQQSAGCPLCSKKGMSPVCPSYRSHVLSLYGRCLLRRPARACRIRRLVGETAWTEMRRQRCDLFKTENRKDRAAFWASVKVALEELETVVRTNPDTKLSAGRDPGRTFYNKVVALDGEQRVQLKELCEVLPLRALTWCRKTLAGRKAHEITQVKGTSTNTSVLWSYLSPNHLAQEAAQRVEKFFNLQAEDVEGLQKHLRGSSVRQRQKLLHGLRVGSSRILCLSEEAFRSCVDQSEREDENELKSSDLLDAFHCGKAGHREFLCKRTVAQMIGGAASRLRNLQAFCQWCLGAGRLPRSQTALRAAKETSVEKCHSERLTSMAFHSRTSYLAESLAALAREELKAAPQLQEALLLRIDPKNATTDLLKIARPETPSPSLPKGDTICEREPENVETCERIIASLRSEESFVPPWPNATAEEVSVMVDKKVAARKSLRPGETELLLESAAEIAHAVSNAIAPRGKSVLRGVRNGMDRIVLLPREQVIAVVRKEICDEPNCADIVAILEAALQEGRARFDTWLTARIHGALAMSAAKNFATVREIAAYCWKEKRLPCSTHVLRGRFNNLIHHLPEHLVLPVVAEFELQLSEMSLRSELVCQFRSGLYRHRHLAQDSTKQGTILGKFASRELRRRQEARRELALRK